MAAVGRMGAGRVSVHTAAEAAAGRVVDTAVVDKAVDRSRADAAHIAAEAVAGRIAVVAVEDASQGSNGARYRLGRRHRRLGDWACWRGNTAVAAAAVDNAVAGQDIAGWGEEALEELGERPGTFRTGPSPCRVDR